MAEHVKMVGSEFLVRNFMKLHYNEAIMLSVAKAKTPYAEQTFSILSSYPLVQLVWSWFWKILWAFQFSSVYLVL
jgi:hypothetical protein